MDTSGQGAAKPIGSLSHVESLTLGLTENSFNHVRGVNQLPVHKEIKDASNVIGLYLPLSAAGGFNYSCCLNEDNIMPAKSLVRSISSHCFDTFGQLWFGINCTHSSKVIWLSVTKVVRYRSVLRIYLCDLKDRDPISYSYLIRKYLMLSML